MWVHTRVNLLTQTLGRSDQELPVTTLRVADRNAIPGLNLVKHQLDYRPRRVNDPEMFLFAVIDHSSELRHGRPVDPGEIKHRVPAVSSGVSILFGMPAWFRSPGTSGMVLVYGTV